MSFSVRFPSNIHLYIRTAKAPTSGYDHGAARSPKLKDVGDDSPVVPGSSNFRLEDIMERLEVQGQVQSSPNTAAAQSSRSPTRCSRDGQLRGLGELLAHPGQSRTISEHVVEFNPYFQLPSDKTASRAEDMIILISKKGVAFAMPRQEVGSMSTLAFEKMRIITREGLSVLHFDRADAESLTLVLMTFLRPGDLYHSELIELVQAFPSALKVARIYMFRSFPERFSELCDKLRKVDAEGKEVEVKVDPSILFAVAVLSNDAHGSHQHMGKTILEGIFQKATTSKIALESQRNGRTKVASASYTNRIHGGPATAQMTAGTDISILSFIPPVILQILKESKPACLTQLLKAYDLYFSLYDRFARDLDVNIRLEGFGTKCKRRFGRGCEAFILSNGNFATLRKIAARATLKTVVENGLKTMCGRLEDSIEDAVRCTTCAHRIVNAYDAVLRSHFHDQPHRW
ncbi:hypothetical protein IAT40_003443 [Kwoniella sp. CBS 6097]